MHKIILMAALIFALVLPSCTSWQVKEGAYRGLSEEEVLRKLGEPDSKDEYVYTADKPLHEYQSGLYEVLKEEEVKVKELWWESRNVRTIIWLREVEGKWVSVDSLQYPPGVVAF